MIWLGVWRFDTGHGWETAALRCCPGVWDRLILTSFLTTKSRYDWAYSSPAITVLNTLARSEVVHSFLSLRPRDALYNRRNPAIYKA